MMVLTIYLLDETVTFIWLKQDDHNVHEVSKERYEKCDTTSLPTEPMSPNYEFKGTVKGTHYFICTVANGFHCKNRGVKASVIVVEHVHECPFHPYN